VGLAVDEKIQMLVTAMGHFGMRAVA